MGCRRALQRRISVTGVARVEAVIFDWGGTLTPWRPIDYRGEARALASYVDPDRLDEVADAIFAAGAQVWGRSREEHRSATLAELCEVAGIEPTEEAIAAYRAFWEPATITDPDVRPLWEGLRADGVRVGVLSNTIWPRAWHREFFARDGVLDLVDGDVYTSELEWTKPDRRAFEAALSAVGVGDPGRAVYVGDRLFEDVWGPAQLGMRTIWVPHSDIPDDQRGHTEGEPDATVHRLADIAQVLASWGC
jgi:putative hydrolase of the HAD superfamily